MIPWGIEPATFRPVAQTAKEASKTKIPIVSSDLH